MMVCWFKWSSNDGVNKYDDDDNAAADDDDDDDDDDDEF
jgi:hypothetical protein